MLVLALMSDPSLILWRAFHFLESHCAFTASSSPIFSAKFIPTLWSTYSAHPQNSSCALCPTQRGFGWFIFLRFSLIHSFSTYWTPAECASLFPWHWGGYCVHGDKNPALRALIVLVGKRQNDSSCSLMYSRLLPQSNYMSWEGKCHIILRQA